MLKYFLAVCSCLLAFCCEAQINPALLNGAWPAQWITCPNAPQRSYGVYYFRKVVQLNSKPNKFIVHLSADNRYRFLVNGQPVCFGPAQGDLYNWYFETVDIAPYLHEGTNVLAATVWNMGEWATVSQVTNQTGLVVQGNGDAEQVVNTNNSWQVLADSAYAPCATNMQQTLKAYYALGPGDHFTASRYPWGWQTADYNTSGWKDAIKASTAVPLGYGTDNKWTLVPRSIPLMEQTMQRLHTVRRYTGLTEAPAFINGKSPLHIAAGKKVTVLIDQSFNTLGYPELIVSKGRNATIRISYAEALFKDGKKDNRNEIEGKELLGNYDLFEPDGQSTITFRPLWQRSFRYLQLEIETRSDELIIEDLYNMYTGYPLQEKARFVCNDTSLKEIWNVGWRTARLCANETYYDCPYYEQLQYVGDTRIQSLISLYTSGDDRLMKKAINDFYNSRVPEGLTQGRYPSNRLQVIPPFSLYWVSMLYDYLMHQKDDAFLRKYLTAAKGVLGWYEERIDAGRLMLGPMQWWNFTDWSGPFVHMGVPPGAVEGNSALITLQFSYTLQQAAALFRYFNRHAEAAHYTQLALKLNKATYDRCFDKTKGLLGDTPGKNTFSQHTNIMGVLADALDPAHQQQVLTTILRDTSLAQASFYYRFYLVQALKKAGMAELYYSLLTPWRNMLAMGLTTFAETPEPTRSDCHAWSASPNYDFLATICGITPLSAGFKTVQVKPAMGALTFISGTMPSPLGEIKVEINKQRGAVIELPQQLSGVFIWKGKTWVLKPGNNKFTW